MLLSYLALTPAKVDKVLRHVWLTAQMHVEVRGQHMVSPKPFVVRLARCGTGDTVGAGQRHGARLVDRIMKTVAAHGGVGGTEQRVLHKRGLGIAELLQACGHACSTRYQPHLRIALPVLVFEPFAQIHQTAAFSVYRQPSGGVRLQGCSHSRIGGELRAKMFWEAATQPDGVNIGR